MRCENCGAELPEGARFCYMCAAPVVGNDGERPAAADEPAAADAEVAAGDEVEAESEAGGQVATAADGEAIAAAEEAVDDAAAQDGAADEGEVAEPAAERGEDLGPDAECAAGDDSADEADGAAGDAEADSAPAEPSPAEYLSNMPEPVKLEGALPVGAVPFVPMAPAPRSTYVPRHNARPVRSGRPGMSSTAGIPNGSPIHARQHEQGWSLEGVTPRDPRNMIERRNESDDPIGSLRNKMNRAFSSIGGSSATREEKKRAEREAFDAAYAEQVAEESRARARADLAARRAVIHAEQHEARAALAGEGAGQDAAPSDEAAAGQGMAGQAAAEQHEAEVQPQVAGQHSREPQPEEVGQVANPQVDEPSEAMSAEVPESVAPAEPMQENLPGELSAAAAAAVVPGATPADLDEEVLEAEGEDPGIEPLPDPDDISGLWNNAPARTSATDAPAAGPADGLPVDMFDEQDTSDLGPGLGARAARQPRDGRAPSTGARRVSSRNSVPRAVVAGVALLVVAIVAFGAVTMARSPEKTATQQQQEQAASTQQQSDAAEQQQEEAPVAETKAEPVARASVNDYSWAELSEISALISAAPSDAEGLAVAKKYNLCSASGTLDGTQVKELQLSDGTSIGMRIVGFRHDTRADGSGKAGITLMADSTVGAQAMNDGDAVDWSATSLRTWLNGEFASLLPAEVSGKIVQVTKTTTRATEMSAQETTSDKVWLISYSELVGDIDSGSSRYGSYLSEGAQYQLFADFGCVWSENSEHYMVGGGLARWWTRSPDPLSSNNVIAPDNETGAPGYARNHAVSDAVGVVPAFCI